MGGSNQHTLNLPANGSKQAGIFRIHENKGEVHLHDDTNLKKFACPVSDFYAAWRTAKSNNFSSPFEIAGHDGKNSPVMAKFEKVVSNGKMDVSISIEPISLGDTISQIDQFVAGH